MIEFLNAGGTRRRSARGLDRAGDAFEALVESLVRGGVMSAQDAAALVSTDSNSSTQAHLLSESDALRVTLRDALETFATAAQLSSMQIATLNAVLEVRRNDVRLVAGTGCLAWGTESADPLARALTLVTLDGVALLTSPEDLALLRRCAGVDCDRLFIDRTKNRSGRWCEMSGCGNRAKARRFHERRRGLILPADDASQADGVP